MTLKITKDDVGTVFRTRTDTTYRMIAWNEGSTEPVIVADPENPDDLETYSVEGRFLRGNESSPLDLIARVEPRREYWVDVYDFGCAIEVGGTYPSVSDAERNVADRNIGQYYLGTINVTDQIEALLEKSE